MVRKIVFSLLVLGLLLLATPSQAYAYQIYESGNISSTYTEIFKDILDNIPSDTDHLYFRNGQYEYILLVGDIELNGTTFKSTDYTEYNITTNSSGYNQSNYIYTVSTGNNLNLNVGNNLVYSNLGQYPTLVERGSGYEFALLFVSLVFGACALLRPIFKWIMRNSSGK